MPDAAADVAMTDVFALNHQLSNREGSPLESAALLAGGTAPSEATPAAAKGDGQSAGGSRPTTPPPSQPVFAAQNTSSGSSQDSIVLATKNTTLSPLKSAQNAHRVGEQDSPDPLRLIPVGSAASSSARSRSHSIEPSRDLLRSSPSRSTVRSHSKTPVSRDQAGENDPSGSDEVFALRATPTQTRPRPSPGHAISDDELGMSPIRSSGAPRSNSDKSADAGRKSTRRKKGSVPAASPSAERGPSSKSTAPSLGVKASARSAQTRHHTFELIIDEPAKPPSPRPTRESSASTSSHPTSPPVSATARTTQASAKAGNKLAASSHPLSQTLSRDDLANQTSPLTSLPPTPAPGQAVAPSPFSPPPPSKPKRRRTSLATAPVAKATDASFSEDEGATTSSTVSNPSPKKKFKARLPRASQVNVPPSGDEVGSSSQVERGKSARRKTSTDSPAKATKGRRRKSAPTDDVPAEVRQFAAEANRNKPRRSGAAGAKKPTPKYNEDDSSESDTESESDAGSDFDAGPSTSSPKKPTSPKKPGRPRKAAAPVSKKAPVSKGKGKGKPVAERKSSTNGDKPTSSASVQTPASSPSKQNGLSAPEAFGSQSLITGKATRQTAEERKAGWDMLAFPSSRPIWVHVQKDGKGGFWWPGEIEGSIFARPLAVRLYLDSAETIKTFADEHLNIEEPSSELLATFRNPSRLRFDQRIFRDVEGAPADETPTDEAFATVLTQALERDAGGDDDDDEDDLLPTPFGPSGSRFSQSKPHADEASDEDEFSEQAEQAQSSGDEADKLIRADDREADVPDFDYPFLCLAMTQKTWWAARCTGWLPGSPTKPTAKKGRKGKGAKGNSGKYVVEFTDGTTMKLPRDKILMAKDKDFFTVKMGQTEIDVSKKYIADLKTFVMNDMLPVYQQVIDETYPIAKSWNDDFHAGGQKRERLAKRSKFGEYTDDLVEIFQSAIDAWASGEGSETGPPQGSARYAALTDGERVQYRTDVLLPIAIIENYIDDRNFFEAAEAMLKGEEGIAAPTDDEIKLKACELAEQDLDLRSVTKGILAIRESRNHVQLLAQSRQPRKRNP
ncbi:hypothetical protein JCM10908_004226 [Rhodotorula pacifica]|uniref:uncharacterized protein n=1 Tax=Rhodotorula pacifica TaxID=1495444 RepID=UPI00317A62CF